MKKYIFGKDFYPYNENLVELFYKKRICSLPLSFYLLDIRKTDSYCHVASNVLTCVLEGAVRVEGQIDSIIGDDKSHSWVEKDDEVYDASVGIVWKKESFYEKFAPFNIVTYKKDDIIHLVKEYFESKNNTNELFMAWIKDLENGMNESLYPKSLTEHIKRFKDEKNLDNQKIDYNLVESYMNDLNEEYKNTQEFLNNAELEETNSCKH